MSFDINNLRVGVIGLGYVGLPLAVEFAKHYPTVGFDVKAERIEELKRGLRGARKFSPEAVWEDRERLELSRADYAELVGVTPLTIYNWEHGRSEPRRAQLEKWLAVRDLGKREAWRRQHHTAVERYRRLIADLRSQQEIDMAMLTVALTGLRRLVEEVLPDSCAADQKAKAGNP